jgi:hypothetical protein
VSLGGGEGPVVVLSVAGVVVGSKFDGGGGGDSIGGGDMLYSIFVIQELDHNIRIHEK